MDEELTRAFNDQVALEFESMYAYLQMAAYFDTRNLPGFAHWMRLQADEERGHALLFFDFILDRGEEVELAQIPAPKIDAASPLTVFEHALEHERKVSASIHGLYRRATETGDYASFPILQRFIDEQIEEEALIDQIVERLRLAGDDPSALLLLDSELGARQAAA